MKSCTDAACTRNDRLMRNIFEVPSGSELVDIALVALFGVAIWRMSVVTSMFAKSPAVAKALWTGCAMYASTQFLTDHAEAQGIMMCAAWLVAWEAKRLKKWKILMSTVAFKGVILLSLFFWPV